MGLFVRMALVGEGGCLLHGVALVGEGVGLFAGVALVGELGELHHFSTGAVNEEQDLGEEDGELAMITECYGSRSVSGRAMESCCA